MKEDRTDVFVRLVPADRLSEYGRRKHGWTTQRAFKVMSLPPYDNANPQIMVSGSTPKWMPRAKRWSWRNATDEAVYVIPVSTYRDLTQPDYSPQPHIFLDCDGVLADFEWYATALFGMPPREYERLKGAQTFWKELREHGSFYRDMPLMPDARKLYDGVKHLNPTILTGVPRGSWAEEQKVAWAARHFPGVPVITCRSADKRLHAKPGDVLIDDWPEHRHRWIQMGGTFISHFSAETSLKTLWAYHPELENPDA